MTRFALAACLALGFALPASPGDVCVDAGNPTFVFKKVKSLKKPGSAVALQGFYLLGGSAPVTGTAIVLQNGSVQLGVTVHTTPPLGAYPSPRRSRETRRSTPPASSTGSTRA